MNPSQKTVTARITGRVQGVAFRAWTRREAESLGLVGWVRNEPDGAVSALFQGPQADVDSMTDRLWQGPPAARVDNVTISEAPVPETFSAFDIRR